MGDRDNYKGGMMKRREMIMRGGEKGRLKKGDNIY